MDIKNILEKLSEIDARQTLLESAPAAEVLAESVVTEPAAKQSIYDILVSELLSEKVTLGTGKPVTDPTTGVTAGEFQGKEPGAGIANPPPNLNVAPPAGAVAPAAAAPGAAPAADAKPGFADRLKTAFQQQSEKNAQYNKEMAAAGTPEAKAEWAKKLTPSQLKWLGGADPSDPAIRSRMPAPLPGETTPAANTAAAASQSERDDAAKVDATATTSPVATPVIQSKPLPTSDQAAADARQDAEQSEIAVQQQQAAEPASAGGSTPDAPAPAAPAAPAVTANPTAEPAKTAYKGSAGAQEIQKLNPAIKDVNKIQAGQTLKMPDGSTYTVKPGDTLDRIAKGVKPADDRAKVPPAKPAPDQYGKAPPAVPAPATPPAPFKKELDLSRLQKLSGQSPAPAAPAAGKIDLSVNNPAMNPVNNTTPVSLGGAGAAAVAAQRAKMGLPTQRQVSPPSDAQMAKMPESVQSQDDAILQRIRSALKF